MKPWLSLFLLVFLFAVQFNAQDIILSESQFVEYQQGNLPVVIAVAHGGLIKPDSIPNRVCNNPILDNDVNLVDVARTISNSFEELTGCHPHIIINHLHRSKVDCNRSKILGTCFVPIAEKVWDEYHHYLTTALDLAAEENNGNNFLIDLHGHEHAIQRVELGYLITGVTLQALNTTIDLDDPIHLTSIEDLIQNNVNDLSRSQLIRGFFAFGSLLEDQGIASVPSKLQPYPMNSNQYRGGGYATETYGAPENATGTIAIHTELNHDGLRDSPAHIQKFGDAFAASLNSYIQLHREQELVACGKISELAPPPAELLLEDLVLYPNPAQVGITSIRVSGKDVLEKKYAVHNLNGELVSKGLVNNYFASLKPMLPAGMYIFTLKDGNETVLHTRKFVLVE